MLASGAGSASGGRSEKALAAALSQRNFPASTACTLAAYGREGLIKARDLAALDELLERAVA